MRPPLALKKALRTIAAIITRHLKLELSPLPGVPDCGAVNRRIECDRLRFLQFFWTAERLMDNSQFSAIRLLRLAMLAALVLPILLFGFLAVTSYRHTQRVADQRIERTVNVLHEHGLKIFETVERVIAETNEVVRGMSDDEVRANEKQLHDRLRTMVESLPQLQSLWIFGSDGRALVNSLVYPNPDVDFSDRDYFRAQMEKDVGLYFGRVLRPREPYPGGDFFSVSRRRPSADGSFRGVV